MQMKMSGCSSLTSRARPLHRNMLFSELCGQNWLPPTGIELFLVILVGSLLLSGCHSKPRLTTQEAEGKHLYDGRCAHCHEENDLALKKAPPDLHDLFDHKTLPSGIPATDAAIAANVLNGRGMMPSFAGRFSNEQMAALLAYLHTGMSR